MGVLAISGAGLYGVGADPSILAAEGLTAFPLFGDFESIATVTLSSATTDITLSSIPSTYKHLQLRIITRSTFSAGSVNVSYRLNTDTNYSNYWWHVLAGNGSTAYAGQLNASTQALLQQSMPAATAIAGVYGAMIVDILDYANTSKNTTLRTFGGFDNNGNGSVGLYSSSWSNTSAVNSFTLRSWDPQWAAGTSVALYGIRG